MEKKNLVWVDSLPDLLSLMKNYTAFLQGEVTNKGKSHSKIPNFVFENDVIQRVNACLLSLYISIHCDQIWND